MSSNLGNKRIMADNIRYYMDLNKVSRKEVCQAIGVKYTTFTDWVKGNVYPRIDKIELMADYFGVSKADLVEEHCDKMIVTKEEYAYVLKVRKMDEQSKNLVLTIIEMESKRSTDHLIAYANQLRKRANYEGKYNEEENK